eukprot:TRINITY_DN9650_c0_g1_i1.p1 TRINITY_DN9650_c0_g1~~TRINITY_DN9650_c0_g1_i1.p1  ORF type:complete len:277 (-),score=44.06 TRINITY_DN9650_c0_g1_i1:1004-1834(-)
MAHLIDVHPYNGYGNAPGPPPLPGSHVGRATGSQPALPLCKFTLPSGLPVKNTTYPYVTGSSVLAIKYADGVMMVTDTLGAYGSTLRYKSVTRMNAVGTNTLIGASGEISDYIYINTLLEELSVEDVTADDGNYLSPQEIHSYLCRVMYNRRNKFDPLWNSVVVAGVQDNGESFLGVVNKIGLHYQDKFLATGFGNYLAVPLFAAEHREDMSESEAVLLLEKCVRVLYYRDRAMLNKIQLAKVTKAGVDISEPYALSSYWEFNVFQDPSKANPGTW